MSEPRTERSNPSPARRRARVPTPSGAIARGSRRCTRVLLVDGEALFREGLRSLLERYESVRVVGEAASARQAAAQVAKTNPDLVVAAFSLPDDEAGGVLDELREKCPEVRVIVLTAHESEETVSRALAGGAQGFVLKNAPSELLVKAIRAVAAGEVWVQREVMSQISNQLHRLRARSSSDPKGRLTPRETQVLKLLASGHSTAAIAQQLRISQSTVRVHLLRISGKLHLKNRIQAVRYAIKQGLVQL